MGRSYIRGTPVKVKWPPSKDSAAVNGRIAVPALPKKISRAGVLGWSFPPNPLMLTVLPTLWGWQPNCSKALSMTCVSSESSKSCTVVVP